jgi:hypothetical protein
MPPTQKLDDSLIDQFVVWVTAGAVWPESTGELRPASREITLEDRQWWAFQPVIAHDISRLPKDDWTRNEIDRFVLADLRKKGIEPAPQAEPAALLRRLYLRLVGLPPTPDEIATFVRDPTPEAYEQVVDRLLDDHRFGEHWARFWLDLVRYSESDGWNQDAYRPNIFRYRDYVISAFNEDVPYSQFVRQQLAGDEQPEDDPRGLIAAGFLRLGIYEYNQRDARGHWNDIMNELTDVVGDAFLGLSLSCARCHDHKFDPIAQQDYFQMRAFFEPIIWRDDLTASTALERQAYQEKLAAWETETEAIREKLKQLQEPYEKQKWASTVDKFPLDIQACFFKPASERNSWEEQMAYLVSRQYVEEGGGPYSGMKKEDQELRKQYLSELAAFDALKPAPLPNVMTVMDHEGEIADLIFASARGEQCVAPETPEVLPRWPEQEGLLVRPGTTGRRTQLATWITHPENPLTNRVITNRVWQQLFGRGLVQTASDFGTLGDKPSQSDLLDWLTLAFIQSDGRIKSLCKTIVMSSTWQQSAAHPEAERNQSLDPEERSWWRYPVRRLSAEQIRDAMLAASGELLTSFGGPSVEETEPRRSIYVKSLRNNTSNFLHSFDMANGLQSIAMRDVTTTPLQALTLLNSRFVQERAKKMAARISSQSSSVDELVDQACLLAWGRVPEPAERDRLHGFLALNLEDPDAANLQASQVEDLCHVLMNSNPFLYVE